MFVNFTVPKMFIQDEGDEYRITLSFENIDELHKKVEVSRREQEVHKARIVGKPPTVLVGKKDITH